MAKVLMVEDDPQIGNLMKAYFEKSFHEVALEKDGVEGYMKFKSEQFDLVLLDIMLPGIDGFEIAQRIRKESDVPIIMVTARSDDEDQIKGYHLKIDDYITKPFNPEILMLKANHLLERLKYSKDKETEIQSFEIKGLRIDYLKRKVYIDGDEIKLEPKQYQILKYLIDNKTQVITRDELLDKIWGYDYFGSSRVVDSQIKKLRSSMKHKSYMIKTVISVGYTFEEE
ncbi:MAG: response regulator transcription factor [Tissierellales bacterium]|jgi:DNA-binding response OmpR family regulator|nr:response regulator transcription factor [Tissierellales bacterium]